MTGMGVRFTDAKGRAVSLEEGILRLADATGKMDRQKAVSLLAKTGFDEKSVNMLLQGRKGLEGAGQGREGKRRVFATGY